MGCRLPLFQYKTHLFPLPFPSNSLLSHFSLSSFPLYVILPSSSTYPRRTHYPGITLPFSLCAVIHENRHTYKRTLSFFHTYVKGVSGYTTISVWVLCTNAKALFLIQLIYGIFTRGISFRKALYDLFQNLIVSFSSFFSAVCIY